MRESTNNSRSYEYISKVPPFLGRDTLEYMFAVGTLGLAVTFFILGDIVWLSREYSDSLGVKIVPPWLPFRLLGSRGMDLTDPQWCQLTMALPVIFPLFSIFLFISHRLKKLRGERRLNSLYKLHVVSGMLIGFGISGPGFIFTILLLLGNFYVVTRLYKVVSYTTFMTIMWGMHIAVFFINNYYNGYRFAWFGLGFLDKLVTPMIKWTVHYNMSVLRMIAFSTDMREASVSCHERREKVMQKHEASCIECARVCEANAQNFNSYPDLFSFETEGVWCYKLRSEYPRDASEYNLLSYLGYVFYPPLYIAGPISSFNAYVSYMVEPTRAIDEKGRKKYGLRTLFSFFLMIASVHYVYVMAILKDQQLFSSISFPRRAILLYCTLGFVWLKFNCVWKLFRFIALLDGFDAPEDMRRCFTNTVSIQGFWRDWHASFNLWIVRYMYIPMGGNKKKLFNIFPIFLFIAIWHDVALRLIHWAGCISIIFLLELLVTHGLFGNKAPLHLALIKHPLLYRYIRTFAACIMMLALIIVNLVGFSIGLGGAQSNLKAMWNEASPSFCFLMVFYFYMAATVAIQDRDQEKYEEYQLRVKYRLLDGRQQGNLATTTGSAVPHETPVSICVGADAEKQNGN